MKYKLFYYQKKLDLACDKAFTVQRLNSFLVQLPTRGGKSGIIISQAEKRRKNGYTTWVIVHRDLLVREFIESFEENGHDVGVIHPEYPVIPQKIMICSIKTLVLVMDRLPILTNNDLLVFDETHHAPASTWDLILKAQPHAQRLGTTACTSRLDKKPLKTIFESMISGPQISELQTFGRLALCKLLLPDRIKQEFPEVFSPGKGFSTDNPIIKKIIKRYKGIVGDPIATYKKVCPGAPALVFCSSKGEADKWAGKFQEAGYNFIPLYSGMSAGYIYEKINQFNSLGTDGKEIINGIVGVDIFIEGLTVQHCSCIMHLRATDSLNTNMQMNGRGMMTTENKKSVWILDHALNSLRHGLPDQNRIWTLDGQVKLDPVQCWECVCGTSNYMRDLECRACGTERASLQKARERGEIPVFDSEMIHIENRERDHIIERIRKARTHEDFIEIAESQGYSTEWAYNKWLDYLRLLRGEIKIKKPEVISDIYGYPVLDVAIKKNQILKEENII
jgi:superfamily II DNA or RNA helicase